MWKEKAKELTLGIAGGLWATLAPIHSILGVVFALVFLDFIAGVYRSVVVKKEAFSSARMRQTVVKLVPYLIVLLAGFGLDHLTGLEGLWFTRAFALLTSSAEIASIGENTGFDLGKIIRDKLTANNPPKE